MIIPIVRGGGGSENDDKYHNFYSIRKLSISCWKKKELPHMLYLTVYEMKCFDETK